MRGETGRGWAETEGPYLLGPSPSPGETQPARGDRLGPRSVVVLLPALNEEAAVGSVIDRVPFPALRHSGYAVGVWVVDGRSKDATLRIARERGANVFVQAGKGKGNGVRQAVDYLTGRPNDGMGDRLYVMLDADGTYPPEQIDRLLAALEAGADVVLGSRFRGHIEDGAVTGLNRIGNRLLSALATLLFGVPVSDVCTGMWGFREGCLRTLDLEADGFDLEADLYSAACDAGARIVEIPVDYGRRIGEPKLIPLRNGVRIALRLLARRLNRPAAPARPIGLRRRGPAEGPA